MGPHVNIRSFLEESRAWAFDPLHGHCFDRLAAHELSAIQRSRLFFRDCLVCGERVLTMGRRGKRRSQIWETVCGPGGDDAEGCPDRPTSVAPVLPNSEFLLSRQVKATPVPDITSHPPTPPAPTVAGTSAERGGLVICQCLDCGHFVHRGCLSAVHSHRRCRGYDGRLLPSCPQSRRSATLDAQHALNSTPSPTVVAWSTPIVWRVPSARRKRSTVTIASLIDDLTVTNGIEGNRTNSTSHNSFADNTLRKDDKEPSPDAKPAAAMIMKRAMPFLAAGGVLGAIALGPAAGVLAGINVFMAGVTVEGVVAGLGFTAATAAATATHQLKRKQERQRVWDELASGSWAMQVCWKCKQEFRGRSEDDAAHRMDAALLRRFQFPRRPAQHCDPDAIERYAPTKDEIYSLLFGVFSSSSELLAFINAELSKTFRDRLVSRRQSQSASVAKTCKETLQDAKMYVAHVVGATMQIFPSLASTDDAVICCSQAVERVIFDDIYTTVQGVLDSLCADVNSAFYANLDDIRQQREQDQRPVLQILVCDDNSQSSSAGSLLDPDLQVAEAYITEMMTAATSPLHKLDLLCLAFRSICCFADKFHQTASNADILIPIVCAVLASSSHFLTANTNVPKNFVSQIAYISFFTGGGGKGVEGYVLTTFQAALQVVAAVDVSKESAQEIDYYMRPPWREDVVFDGDVDEEMFFDAKSAH